ncbi:hypothetical protein B0A81_15455 [Flavobacterium plurextorum]|uniref:Secretion system C-terminal sorting domain-containing protein n=1 Tax=Flavobacterium plurextorum TaxID=1114867 RepID=A0ABX4CRA0_9FLAO|nr:T9SS type A sorting domain-containing protein [Flavobacterium plurextorum]OXB05101.1 hypothetical protein B0A81_15455 [Flavobacterium plurextorum]
MKKKLTLLFTLVVIGVSAQTDCEQKIRQVKKILDGNKLYKDYGALFQDILPCAESGDPLAENYIGLMYVNALGIEKDEAKGFAYIEKAAKTGSAVAQCNLGNLYNDGRGCTLDMNKAVEWYKKAADKQNSRALYLLGYMHLKGLGVQQNYEEAIAWFKKSDYAMAKHWLGVCYYLGYGVPQDTNKALEYLQGNTTPNSVAFLRNLKNEKRDLVIAQTENAINEANKAAKKIDPELINESREIVTSDEAQNQNIKTNTILGEWTGRFIEYDWSGTTPIRVLPIEISFSKNDKGALKAKINFEGKSFENSAQLNENTLFLNDFKFKLDQLYPHDFKNDQLEYAVLGMNLSQKSYNNKRYLLADVDSFIAYWREPGTPISVILRPKNDAAFTDDDAVLLALASQKAEFIKVYPVPFNEQLYVAFDLKEPAKIHLTLTNVMTAQTQKVVAANLEAGIQSFTVDTSNLPKGFYIVQVQENEKQHTRTIIKQ